MFTIDKMSRIPIYEQLIAGIEASILSGQIDPDGKLPSVRYLSQHLGINPNTLQRAYLEIEHRGLCYTVPGSGRFLTRDALDRLAESSLKQTEELEHILSSLKDKGISKDVIMKVVAKVYDENKDERMVETE